MEIIVLILGIVVGGWILALVFGIKLFRARRQIREIATNALWQSTGVALAAAPTAATTAAPTQDLLVLRLELKDLARIGHLKHERFNQLADNIDGRLAEELTKAGIDRVSGTWQERRETAWRILVATGCVPAGPPPWTAKTPTAIEESTVPPASAANPATCESPWQPAEPAARTATSVRSSGSATPIDARSALPKTQPIPPKPHAKSVSEHAWKPSSPSALEKALRTVAKWPQALLPFLVQNVGWFVGVFCFLAGSIFLVAYTSGFTKALTVFGVLFAYTGFLIWAGYRLRLKRPNIRTASYALMTMGLLLVPLNFSAAARLLLYAGNAWLLAGIGLLATAVMVAVFFVTAQVVSGVNDRTLQNQHARLFLMLAGAQLGVPLVALWPHWLLLALTHVALLALLACGLLRYAHDWIRTIFVERRKTAYFAAGTLLYAAVVSFVHLTWGAGVLTLPPGYFAPYLMTVSGLLFYFDAQFKLETRRSVFLSRFTFCIYGLSALAVALAVDAPLARSVTLFLATVIYGVMLWKYLTLAPFYLLLASAGGLYASLVLTHLPPAWHFMASLPGLIGLFAFNRWAQALAAGHRTGMGLALMSYRVLVGLLVAVCGWSLIHSQPGFLPAGGTLVLAVTLWWLFAEAPGPLMDFSTNAAEKALPRAGIDLRNSPWLYLVIAGVTVGVAFSPPLPGITWSLQFSLGLVALSGLWAWFLFRSRHSVKQQLMPQCEALANSALLCLFGAVALAVSGSLGGTVRVDALWLIFAAAAGVLLTLSFGLYVRWLFYGFLAATALSGALLKRAFFPGPSVGMGEMLIALGLWFFTWWLDRQPKELAALREQRARRESLTLLWRFPTIGGGSPDFAPSAMSAESVPNTTEVTAGHAVHNAEELAHV